MDIPLIAGTVSTVVFAVSNLPSQRVAEKAGAVREGVLRRRLLLHGVSHDAVMFSLTRP